MLMTTSGHILPSPTSTRLLTVDEAATRLRVSTWTVRRWAREGRIPVVRLGRTVRAPMRFDLGVLEAWLAGHAHGGKPAPGEESA